MTPLLILVMLLLPVTALANHDGEQETRCCNDGSSPWSSLSKDAWRPNANAGYQGSDLPPRNTGYNPDHLDQYDNDPRYGSYHPTLQQQPAGRSDLLRFDPVSGLCGGSHGACGKER
jgi:hypothetical protein